MKRDVVSLSSKRFKFEKIEENDFRLSLRTQPAATGSAENVCELESKIDFRDVKTFALYSPIEYDTRKQARRRGSRW